MSFNIIPSADLTCCERNVCVTISEDEQPVETQPCLKDVELHLEAKTRSYYIMETMSTEQTLEDIQFDEESENVLTEPPGGK